MFLYSSAQTIMGASGIVLLIEANRLNSADLIMNIDHPLRLPIMLTLAIQKSSTTCASIALFIPALAFAAVADPGQFIQQSTRFSAKTSTHSAPQEERVSQLMVKPRYQIGDGLNHALMARDASKLANASNVSMSVIRQMSGNAHVISLGQPVTLSEARAIAARLMRDNTVEFAEPDRFMHPLATTPTDPDYAAYQWDLQALSSSNQGSANLPNAWSITTGSNSVTVAVIDSGYRQHVDLGTILPGYNFVSDIAVANNGYGRGPDAQDPGDWVNLAENASGQFQGCGVSNSSWHGTHVTGIIAATMSNAIGITGIAPNVRILPVRVLGKCGGFDSDIIDGMRWAAGIAVPNTPNNVNPAQVLNLSLGGGGSDCSQAYQSAVSDITLAGKVIVAAAGNDGTSNINSPGNCTGVIAVTAHAIDGDNAWYATIGTGITLSAPGGGCGGTDPFCLTNNYPAIYSLFNIGLTSPVPSPAGDTYAYDEGTSMATPHVTGVVALMLSLDPTLTPAQIKSYLQSSARPHPPGTICTVYYPGQCGAGLLDAYQALNAVKTNIGVASASANASSVSPGDSAVSGGGSLDIQTLVVFALLAAGLRLHHRFINTQ